MIRHLCLALVLCCFTVGFAQDEPRLERKKSGPELLPKPRELPPIDRPEAKNPESNPGADEIEKAKERIVENSKTAGKRLGDKDPGEETRKVQGDILKDLDELLKQAQNQQNQQNNQQPMGGGSGSGSSSSSGGASGPGQLPMRGASGNNKSSPSGGSSARQERRERREQARNNPMPGKSGSSGGEPKESPEMKSGGAKEGGKDQEKSGTAQGSPSGGNPMNPLAKPTGKFAEVYKDVWGHLPEKLRQEMDLYYREQFMPRYGELLREYYSALSEQRRGINKK